MLPHIYRGELDQFVLVAEVNLTTKREQYLVSQDVLGIPLGRADELYFPNDKKDGEAGSMSNNDGDKVTSRRTALEEGEYFEGDISGVELVAKEDSSESASLNGNKYKDDGVAKNAIKNTYQMWPKGEIPYAISQSFSSYERGVIRKAMTEISTVSCIKWRPMVGGGVDRNYVHILRDAGCYSRVGKVGGPQVLSLGKNRLKYQ